MNIQEAKQIKIADYLQSLGYSPVKQQGNCLWYKSPFRQETEASFKVNTDRNLWFDYGLGRGGNIIALAGVLYASDHVPYLLGKIAEQAPHIRPISFSFSPAGIRNRVSNIWRWANSPIRHCSDTCRNGGINIALAKAQCKELHFTHNGKPYFAIGFPNVAGGFEVRNRFFKGCVAPKDISHIRQQGEAEREMPCIRGHDGLSFIPHVAEEELLELARPLTGRITSSSIRPPMFPKL